MRLTFCTAFFFRNFPGFHQRHFTVLQQNMTLCNSVLCLLVSCSLPPSESGITDIYVTYLSFCAAGDPLLSAVTVVT